MHVATIRLYMDGRFFLFVFFPINFSKMDPRLQIEMIMLFFQVVQLKNKAVQLVMLELERVIELYTKGN